MITKQEQLDYLKLRIKDIDTHIESWEATLVRYLENDSGDVPRAENYLKDLYAEHSRWAQKLRMLEKEPDNIEFKDYL